MSSPYTVDLHEHPVVPVTPVTDAGYVGKAGERSPTAQFAAGIALFIAASTLTAMPDLWELEKLQRDAVVSASPYKAVVGRSISRSEALRVASQILHEAEHQRREVAEFEASRGIQWANEA